MGLRSFCNLGPDQIRIFSHTVLKLIKSVAVEYVMSVYSQFLSYEKQSVYFIRSDIKVF